MSLEDHELFTFRISRVLPSDSNITGVTREHELYVTVRG
jgi:hypothetical protein